MYFLSYPRCKLIDSHEASRSKMSNNRHYSYFIFIFLADDHNNQPSHLFLLPHVTLPRTYFIHLIHPPTQLTGTSFDMKILGSLNPHHFIPAFPPSHFPTLPTFPAFPTLPIHPRPIRAPPRLPGDPISPPAPSIKIFLANQTLNPTHTPNYHIYIYPPLALITSPRFPLFSGERPSPSASPYTLLPSAPTHNPNPLNFILSLRTPGKFI